MNFGSQAFHISSLPISGVRMGNMEPRQMTRFSAIGSCALKSSGLDMQRSRLELKLTAVFKKNVVWAARHFFDSKGQKFILTISRSFFEIFK